MHRTIELKPISPTNAQLTGGRGRFSSFHRYAIQGLYDRDWGVDGEIVCVPSIGCE